MVESTPVSSSVWSGTPGRPSGAPSFMPPERSTDPKSALQGFLTRAVQAVHPPWNSSTVLCAAAAVRHTRDRGGSPIGLCYGATPVSRGHLTALRSAALDAGWVERRNSGFSPADW
jgi:hypothetical protein